MYGCYEGENFSSRISIEKTIFFGSGFKAIFNILMKSEHLRSKFDLMAEIVSNYII